jgi:hypothetical protein
MKICEQIFPVTDLLPPTIWRHMWRVENSGAVSGFDWNYLKNNETEIKTRRAAK